MALSFDHATKRIGVPQADAQPILMQALINAIRTEEASERGICYDQIADASGKDDLGGGVQTGITVSLRSSWKLEFAAGAYQATVAGGNLSDALSRIHNTGSPQVLVQASAASTLVETGVSGLTSEEAAQLAAAAAGAADPADISAAVWQRAIEAGLTAEQLLRLLAAVPLGDATGLDAGTTTFKSLDGSKNRVVGTVAGGTRTVTTRDGA